MCFGIADSTNPAFGAGSLFGICIGTAPGAGGFDGACRRVEAEDWPAFLAASRSFASLIRTERLRLGFAFFSDDEPANKSLSRAKDERLRPLPLVEPRLFEVGGLPTPSDEDDIVTLAAARRLRPTQKLW